MSVGSEGGSGSQRMLIRVETLGAIVCGAWVEEKKMGRDGAVRKGQLKTFTALLKRRL